LRLNFKKLNIFLSLILIMGVLLLIKYLSEKPYELEHRYQSELDKEPKIAGEKTGEILGMVEISLKNLEKNFFTTRADPNHFWLSVSQKNYQGQFYSRDTFITLSGATFAGENLRRKLAYTIDWFSQHMDDDGYIPIWFSQPEKDLNIYWYCPYNKDKSNGGIKQYDHQSQFIEAIWLVYSWEGDKNWLKERIPFARKAWKWLKSQTENGHLIKARISEYCGADWADQIRRGGYATLVEVYWYKATLDMAYMERELGNFLNYFYYLNYARQIKNEINRKLWMASQPVGYFGKAFGHYVGWIDEEEVKDYFEVDSNAFAVGVGVASKNQAQEIMEFINGNFDYLVNQKGATRVLYGNYDEKDTRIEKNASQNGGYWYLTSCFLSMAYKKLRNPKQLSILLERVIEATKESREEGLTEWYYENDKIGGAPNYSWSLAYPLFLFYGQILGIKPVGNGLTIEPCISEKTGDVQTTFKYKGKTITVNFRPGCNKSLFVSDKEIKDGILIKWKE